MRAFCREHGILIQAYSPLTRAERLGDPTLRAVAEAHGKTAAQVILRWNLQQGTVPLPKANRVEHLKENLDIFDLELTEEDMEALSTLNEQYSSLGSLPYV
jgi:diketogulonate reductase-like aldo/keto reductase